MFLSSQNLREAKHSEHHEQRDRQARPVRVLQVPGRHVLHRRLHRVVPRNGQRNRKTHQGKQDLPSTREINYIYFSFLYSTKLVR